MTNHGFCPHPIERIKSHLTLGWQVHGDAWGKCAGHKGDFISQYDNPPFWASEESFDLVNRYLDPKSHDTVIEESTRWSKQHQEAMKDYPKLNAVEVFIEVHKDLGLHWC